MDTPNTERFRQTIRESLKRIDPMMNDDDIDGHSIMCAFDMAVAVLCRHIEDVESRLDEAEHEVDMLNQQIGDMT